MQKRTARDPGPIPTVPETREPAPPRPIGTCRLPPPGWTCSRTAGHDGPCAASPAIDLSHSTLSDTVTEWSWPGPVDLIAFAAAIALCFPIVAVGIALAWYVLRWAGVLPG